MSIDNLIALSEEKDVRPGHDAGWLLAFHTEEDDFKISKEPVCELSRDGYYGEIIAALPSGLEGGVYTFTIEGLLDSDYKKISLVANPTVKVVRLYMFWRDGAPSGVDMISNVVSLPDITGSGAAAKHHPGDLVAELRVQSVKRKAGSRKYETTITARERIYDLVNTRRPYGAEIDAKDLEKATEELMRRIGKFEKNTHFYFYPPRANTLEPPELLKKSKDNAQKLDKSKTGLVLLQQIAGQLEAESNLHGRGMLLVRDGVLYIGPRFIPLDKKKKDPRVLELQNGLVEVQALDPLPIVQNYNHNKNGNKAAPTHPQFKLTLRGRPDLKPGDLIKFDVPPEDVLPKSDAGSVALSILGSVGGSVIASFLPGEMANPTLGYVHSVEHKLGRTTGFVTTLTTIGLKQGADLTLKDDEAWDAWSQGDAAKSNASGAEVNSETGVGKSIARGVHSLIEKLAFTEVGEVREFSPEKNETAPAQTSTIWRGLDDGSGPNQARKANPIRPSNSPAPTVPYLTPFAWGKCGLVIPRYPGMRVAVAHRKANGNDPIDMGALWQSEHAPEKAKLGDWWLSLPAEAPVGNAPAGNKNDSPEDYSKKVTNDLTQQDGIRIIEVGEFTIRIGQDKLKAAGERPLQPSIPGALCIEHASGSQFLIDKDGNITIKAKKDLNIEAENVKVKCSSMDVS